MNENPVPMMIDPVVEWCFTTKCVACKQATSPSEMLLGGEGWLCESCWNGKYFKYDEDVKEVSLSSEHRAVMTERARLLANLERIKGAYENGSQAWCAINAAVSCITHAGVTLAATKRKWVERHSFRTPDGGRAVIVAVDIGQKFADVPPYQLNAAKFDHLYRIDQSRDFITHPIDCLSDTKQVYVEEQTSNEILRDAVVVDMTGFKKVINVVPPLSLLPGESATLIFDGKNFVPEAQPSSTDPATPRDNYGPCYICGKDVTITFPWWTKNRGELGSKPLHDECARIFQERKEMQKEMARGTI